VLSPIRPVPLSIEQYGTYTGAGNVYFTWPEGDPGTGNLLVAFLAARGPAGDYTGFIPWSVPDDTFDSVDFIAGTNWTHLDGQYIGAFSDFPTAMVYRYPTTAADTQYILWGGIAGGSGRPRGHHVVRSGLLAPTTSGKLVTGNISPPFTSPDMTVPGAGVIYVGFSWLHVGPSDNVNAPPGFVLDAVSPAITLTRGYASPQFRPYSWFGYLEVAGAGTYNVGLTATGKVIQSAPAGWQWAFCPSA